MIYRTLVALLGFSTLSVAAEDSFSELRRVAAAINTPERQAVVLRATAMLFGDCSKMSATDLAAIPRSGSLSQYIYNGSYRWTVFQSFDGHPCVYLRSPLNRALTAEEATDFIAASGTRFPVENQSAPDPSGVFPKPMNPSQKMPVVDLLRKEEGRN